MEWIAWFGDTAIGCLRFLGQMALVIIPLMIGVELLKHFRLIEKANRYAQPLMRPLGLPPEAAYPLLAGLLLGLFYGGAMMIESAESGKMTRRDLFLVFLFLCLCHSVIEDHVVLIAVGVPGLMLLGVRFLLAVAVVWVANKVMKKDEQTEKLPAEL